MFTQNKTKQISFSSFLLELYMKLKAAKNNRSLSYQFYYW